MAGIPKWLQNIEILSSQTFDSMKNLVGIETGLNSSFATPAKRFEDELDNIENRPQSKSVL